jgi:ribonuclease BN (tRNA processing enzyme)
VIPAITVLEMPPIGMFLGEANMLIKRVNSSINGLIKKMTEICFLGTGGSVATVERDNTSFLIRQADDLILVDCPGSVVQKVKKLNLEPGDIQTILVTHIHPDHVYGLPSFIHSLMLTECQVDLYGSERTINFCHRFLDLFHLLDKKIQCRVRFFSLEPDQDFGLGNSIQCSAMKVPHNESSLAFGFHFNTSGQSLFYSGDTPVFPPLFESASGADFLIHDCSAPSRFFREFPELKTKHANPKELGRYAQEAGIKSLIPCHFFGELEFSIVEIEREIRENYSGKLIFPEDFMRIAL